LKNISRSTYRWSLLFHCPVRNHRLHRDTILLTCLTFLMPKMSMLQVYSFHQLHKTNLTQIHFYNMMTMSSILSFYALNFHI
jgi:hypothetical protein